MNAIIHWLYTSRHRHYVTLQIFSCKTMSNVKNVTEVFHSYAYPCRFVHIGCVQLECFTTEWLQTRFNAGVRGRICFFIPEAQCISEIFLEQKEAMFQSGNVKTMRRCYFVGHTPAELLRRKFIKDSRLSEGAFTTLHHNCYNEFLLFHSHYDQFAHFEQVAKSRLTLLLLLAGKPDSVYCLCTLGWLRCNQH